MPTLDIDSPEVISPAGLEQWLGQFAEPSGRDRRTHERLPAHELDWLKSAKLRFGPGLSLIDLSASGAQFETSAPLRPGSTAVLTITGRGLVQTASFRVLRCEVARIQERPLYRGACVFDRVIDIPGSMPSQGSIILTEESTGHEQILSFIRSLSARAADPVVGAELKRLIAEIRLKTQRGASSDAILQFVERELGGQAVGSVLAQVQAPVPPPTGPAVIQAAPAPFPRPVPVPVAVGPVAPAPAPVPQAAAGWNKLVVRYLDGTILKGFSQDFHPTRSYFHLAPSIAATDEKPSMVPMQQLKAVFFVRDFSGDPDYVDNRAFAEPSAGRRIEVTFVDGEQVTGTTLGYRPDGTGFFVRPADTGGNNLRVFVPPGGIKRVRFL